MPPSPGADAAKPQVENKLCAVGGAHTVQKYITRCGDPLCRPEPHERRESTSELADSTSRCSGSAHGASAPAIPSGPRGRRSDVLPNVSLLETSGTFEATANRDSEPRGLSHRTTTSRPGFTRPASANESRPTLSTLTIPRIELPCQSTDYDADLWFADRPDLLEEAKSLCRQCPLRTQCLESAMEREEPWGVWGGEIFERGVVIARKRPRGRPRKNAAVA